jgi:signal peptidase I
VFNKSGVTFVTEKPRKAWLAGLLSFLMIGLGHIYNGKLIKGLLLYFAGQSLIGAIVISIVIFFPKPNFIL